MLDNYGDIVLDVPRCAAVLPALLGDAVRRPKHPHCEWHHAPHREASASSMRRSSLIAAARTHRGCGRSAHGPRRTRLIGPPPRTADRPTNRRGTQVNGSYGRMSDLTEALIRMSDATGLAIVSDIVKSWAAASGEERAWKLWRSCGVKLEQFMPTGSSESDVHKHLKDQVSTRLTTAVS